MRDVPGALYQIGIYRHFDPKALGQLLDLNNSNRKTLATRLRNATVGLDQAIGREVSHNEGVRAVEEAWFVVISVRLEADDYTERELASAVHLQRDL